MHPARAVRQLLLDLGYTDVFHSTEPPRPDECITVYYTGDNEDYTMVDSAVSTHSGVQIRWRGSPDAYGMEVLTDLRAELAAINGASVTVDAETAVIDCFGKVGSVMRLGQEPNGARFLYTLNCTVAFGE